MRTWKKWMIGSGSCVFLLLLLGVGFLPKILSTSWGKARLIAYVKRRYAVNLSIENMQLSWLQGQRVEKLSLEKQDHFRGQIALLETNAPLWNLLRRSGSIHSTKIMQPSLTLKGPQNMHRDRRERPFWRHFQGNLSIEDGTISLGKQRIHIEIFEALMTPSDELLALYGKGHANPQGSFTLHMRSEKGKWQGHAKLHAFPIGPLYTLISDFLRPPLRHALKNVGEFLDVALNAQFENEQTQLDVRAASAALKADIACSFAKNRWTLRRPARMEWSLAPTLLNELTKMYGLPMQYTEPVALTAQVDRAEWTAKDFQKRTFFASQGSVLLGKTALNIAHRPVQMQSITATFETKKKPQTATFSLFSQFYEAQSPQTELRASVTLQKGARPPRYQLTKLDAEMRNGPLTLLQHFYRSPPLTLWFGNLVDLNIQWENRGLLTLNVTTPFLHIPRTQFSLENTLKLKGPLTFSYALPKDAHRLLTRPIPTTVRMTTLEIPVKNRRLDWREGLFSFVLTAPLATLSDLSSLGSLEAKKLHLSLQQKTGGSGECHFGGLFDFAPDTPGQLLLGSHAKVDVKALLHWQSALKADPLKLTMQSANCRAIAVGMLEKQTFALTKNMAITCSLPPRWINPLFEKQGNFVALTSQTPVTMEFTELTVPFASHKQRALHLKGTFHIPHLPLVSITTREPFTLLETTGSFSHQKTAELFLQTQAAQQKNFVGDVSFHFTQSKRALWDLKIKNGSTSFFDAITSQKGYLPPILGPSFQLTMRRTVEEKAQSLSVDLQSNLLTLEGDFSYEKDTHTVTTRKKPLTLAWHMTDRGLRALQAFRGAAQQEKSFSIQGTSQLTAKIDHLSMPLPQYRSSALHFATNLYPMTFEGAIALRDLTLLPIHNPSLSTNLERFTAELIKKEVGSTLSFQATSSMSTANGSQGTLRGKGLIKNAFSTHGVMTPQDISASIRIAINNVPTLALDALSSLYSANAPSLSLFLGTTTSLHLDFTTEKSIGEMTADIDATACQAKISTSLAKGIIRLKQPVRATLHITPELNERLTKASGLAIVSVSQPIDLFLDAKGFSMPLKDPHVRAMSLDYGRLNLHQIVCKNRDRASDLSEIFQLNPFQSSLISFWFAPMEFRIAQGRMLIDRTEILYNQAYQIALWGTLDYRKRFASMALGLTAQSLQAALNIRGLDPNYVLAVPIRGPFGNITIDKGAATSKIAFLLARKTIVPHAGPWGQVFGAIGDLADDQSEIPPAKPPFPWD